MGLIRKTMSVGTMGAVDFKSDKERTATYTKKAAKQARKLAEEAEKQTAILEAQAQAASTSRPQPGSATLPQAEASAQRREESRQYYLSGTAFERQQSVGPENDTGQVDSANGSLNPAAAFETYKVIYRGGHPNLPKAKTGHIYLEIKPESFAFVPGSVSKKFWEPLEIAYGQVQSVSVVARQVSTTEGILGGLNSRQLNQDNNIHFAYIDGNGKAQLLRFEMLTGVTVMGQARKCREFEDRLRTLGVASKFQQAPTGQQSAEVRSHLASEIAKLAELRSSGALSDDEFAAAKAKLIS